MRTTAILNLKGGVGKTTTVIHMANILHRDYGARVLVVDCDHQHNLMACIPNRLGSGYCKIRCSHKYDSHITVALPYASSSATPDTS